MCDGGEGDCKTRLVVLDFMPFYIDGHSGGYSAGEREKKKRKK